MYTIKDKFVEMCQLISKDNGEYDFWWGYMDRFNEDEDFLILESKMKNFLSLLNENEDVIKKDIETEVWEMI